MHLSGPKFTPIFPKLHPTRSQENIKEKPKVSQNSSEVPILDQETIMIQQVSNFPPIEDINHTKPGSSHDLRNYLLDSGEFSHFTSYINDLKNPSKCHNQFMLEYVSIVYASEQVEVLINFTSEQGDHCKLTLKRVLYISGLNRRLLSIPAFVRNAPYKVTLMTITQDSTLGMVEL